MDGPARLRADDGVVLLTSLVKVVLVLAVLGLVGFDGVSLGVGALHTADDASAAANAAVNSYSTSHDVTAAYLAAQAALAPGETIPASSFAVDSSGDVQLVVRRKVPTLLLQHIGPLAHYAVITESGRASAPL